VLLITKKSEVALLGGHYIYHIDDTCLMPLTATVGSSFLSSASLLGGSINAPLGKSLTEQRYVKEPALTFRYLQIFAQLDTTKNFYFSPTYDITRTLQYNLTEEIGICNEMFVWNHHLTRDVVRLEKPWNIPIIHGFVDQSKISIYGHNILVTLIARRSRYYAGARFLKRG
jgi:hypothetical protein